MKRLVTLVLLAIGLSTAPLASHADAFGSCTIDYDPSGDTTGAANVFGAGRDITQQPDGAVDLTTVTFASTPDSVLIDMSVRDITDRAGGTATFYEAVWKQGATSFAARAILRSGAPVFQRVKGSRVERTTGAVIGHTIRVEVPRAFLDRAEDGALLSKAGAQAHSFVDAPEPIDAPSMPRLAHDTTSSWPANTDGFYELGANCAPLSDASQPCLLANSPKDASGDLTYDPALDILAVSVSSNLTAVVFEMRVADLTSLPSDGARQHWRFEWGSPRTSLDLSRSLKDKALRVEGPSGMSVGGLHAFDETAGIVRAAVPQRELNLREGARLTSITALAGTSRGVGSWVSQDSVGGGERGLSYQVGIACPHGSTRAATIPDPTITCPVVSDPYGDVVPEPGMRDFTTRLGQGALDIGAAGAHTTDDMVVITARVLRPGERLLRGLDAVGWTMSWSFGDRRWIAQASRGTKGLRFRLARTNRNSSSLSGPIFGGTPATGSINARTGVITINAPRSILGAPQDGEGFSHFGAISWAAREGNPTAYHVFDQTSTDRYIVGTTCSA